VCECVLCDSVHVVVRKCERRERCVWGRDASTTQALQSMSFGFVSAVLHISHVSRPGGLR
jgi:hypothetical protein